MTDLTAAAKKILEFPYPPVEVVQDLARAYLELLEWQNLAIRKLVEHDRLHDITRERLGPAGFMVLEEVFRLRGQNLKMREALEWYADKQNYVVKIQYDEKMHPISSHNPMRDGGQRARAALKEQDE